MGNREVIERLDSTSMEDCLDPKVDPDLDHPDQDFNLGLLRSNVDRYSSYFLRTYVWLEVLSRTSYS